MIIGIRTVQKSGILVYFDEHDKKYFDWTRYCLDCRSLQGGDRANLEDGYEASKGAEARAIKGIDLGQLLL